MKDSIKDAAQNVTDTSQKAAAYIRSIGKDKQSARSGGQPVSDLVRQKLEALVRSLFSVDSLDRLGSLSGTVLSILGKAAISIPPVVGNVKDGYDLFTGWAKAGASLYEQVSVSDRQYTLDTGAPARAFLALRRLLAQETQRQTLAASQQPPPLP